MRKPYKIKGILREMLNNFGAKFFRIKEGGIKAGRAWNDPTE